MELEDNEKFPAKPDLPVPTSKAPTQQFYQSISLVGQLKLPPFKKANFQDTTTDLDLESIQNYLLQHQSMQAYNREDNCGCHITRPRTYSSKQEEDL